jgi:hypothetical protein
MPSTYTLNNGIELIGTGEQSGTWGDTTNTNLELLDTALDGQVTITATSAGSSSSPNDLPISDGSASNGRNRMIIITSATDLGADVYYQLTPNDAEKIIYVRNDLNAQDLILFQGTYSASNDYVVPNGKTAIIFFDGAGTGAVAANVFNNAHFDAMNIVGNVDVGGNVDVTGTLAVTSTSTFSDDVTLTGASYNVVWDKSDNALEFADNAKAIFGAGNDLQIYHDGSNSYIDDAGTGLLRLRSNQIYLEKYTGEIMAALTADAGVNLRYDNGIKLETTSTGVTVTGRVTSTGLTVDSGVLYVDDTNNRVAIGNQTGSAASYPLHVKDTRDNIATFESTDTDVRVNLQDVTSVAGENYIGQIGDKMRFATGGSESLRITGAARIGVNTAGDPQGTYQMEIRQNLAGGAENLVLSNNDTTAGTTQKARLDFGLARNSGALKPSAGRIQVKRERDWTVDDANIDSTMTFSVYQNNAAVEALYIKSNAYIGINTPSLPDNRLEVRADSGEGVRLNEVGATYHDINVTSDDLVIDVDSKGDGVSKFIINNDGNRALTIHTGDQTVIGQATDTHSVSGGVRQLTVEGISGVTSSMAVIRNQNNDQGPVFSFGKSRGTTTGSDTVAIDGDQLGEIRWSAADGTDMDGEAARIFAQAAGGVSTGDTPGRIVFATTPNNAATPVNRMRIDDTGRVSIGAASDLSDATSGEQLMIADQGNGGGLRVRGLSPFLFFDVTGSTPHSRIYHDGQPLKFYTGTPTSEGNLGLVQQANAHVTIGSDVEPGTTSGFGEGLNVVGDSTSSSIGVTRYDTSGGSAPYFRFGRARGSASSPTATQNSDYLGYLQWMPTHDGSTFGGGAGIYARATANTSSTSKPARLEFLTTSSGSTAPAERMRINDGDNPSIHIYAAQNGENISYYHGGTRRFTTAVESTGTDCFFITQGSSSGISNAMYSFTSAGLFTNVYGDARAYSRTAQGTTLREPGESLCVTRNGGSPLEINRGTNDGTLVNFFAQGVVEGSISVSGTTVSYNGGHLARWSQLTDGSKDTSLLKGTVMTNLDQMATWGSEDNEQLNCMAVSSVEGDPNVAGVFVNWDENDYDPEDNIPDTNDMNIAMTGDMIIRIAQGTTVQRGDLLMSAGDGTAKPQGDDIVRGKTIAKVTSTHVTCTYDDGSYCVPCVLMAC